MRAPHLWWHEKLQCVCIEPLDMDIMSLIEYLDLLKRVREINELPEKAGEFWKLLQEAIDKQAEME